ncbi:hypothetical protein RM780_05365 [Streptomyces sp. DSM 44917]|uniref:Uncharacterized protein n=1 Tax=Streptomyces boetiae TaxID=3075541 RepID=A0ABU2L4D2_9ACTN|nr:hypothetical protein [Streptomyces sp. DSM 44917]MDT0306390.1 hypothetical protein [Streptomyces sp. DSM 44917]
MALEGPQRVLAEAGAVEGDQVAGLHRLVVALPLRKGAEVVQDLVRAAGAQGGHDALDAGEGAGDRQPGGLGVEAGPAGGRLGQVGGPGHDDLRGDGDQAEDSEPCGQGALAGGAGPGERACPGVSGRAARGVEGR